MPNLPDQTGRRIVVTGSNSGTGQEAALRLANEELEKRVEERTRELKEAQTRLMDTAREVGMAEIAAG